MEYHAYMRRLLLGRSANVSAVVTLNLCYLPAVGIQGRWLSGDLSPPDALACKWDPWP